MSARPLSSVEIIGGGLAGLSLGLALRQHNIPVTMFDAGQYPRHRVCGEFITGLDETTSARLGLAPFLADAGRMSIVTWFLHGVELRRHRLPSPALTLSRFTLDQRLVEAFVAAGGDLRTGTRVDLAPAPPGRVFCTGRERRPTDWLGLKMHVRGLVLRSELELHLGREAYVGLCPVEDNRVNVCGLFRKQTGLSTTRETVLPVYLRAVGLVALADRLQDAAICPESHASVAGVGFGRHRIAPGRIRLGDAFAVIPPFTGHGMAMAFQSANEALDPLIQWSRGEADWLQTVTSINNRLRRRFRTRLGAAQTLHPFLFSPGRQHWLARANRTGLLPMRQIYHLLH
ncbi:MAG: NAD(P)-binding protein [Verrucomicrobiota bacterium]|nr:NAD(P)-binding protein [Verrucomicrobiota bacterium]